VFQIVDGAPLVSQQLEAAAQARAQDALHHRVSMAMAYVSLARGPTYQATEFAARDDSLPRATDELTLAAANSLLLKYFSEPLRQERAVTTEAAASQRRGRHEKGRV
jgi:hypothetical protein